MKGNVLLEVPESADYFEGELAERGEWIVANISSGLSWPVKPQKLVYGGIRFWILPVTQKTYPGIALKLTDGMTRQEAHVKIMRLLSAISWAKTSGIMVDHFSGGSLPSPMGRDKSYGFSITADLELTYLPEPGSDQERLALALMREGRGLNHPAYSFLSFYRVLEAVLPNGRERGPWIKAHIDELEDHSARKAVEALRSTKVADLGDHLYKSGRQAIAHAGGHPIIDPDDPQDERRLIAELPIMQSLASLAIEKVLSIQTSHTVWKEHLYELAGFKKILGTEFVKKVIDSGEPDSDIMVEFPTVDVEIRNKAPYKPFKAMVPVHLSKVENLLQLVLRSSDGLAELTFFMDFPEERLRFDWQTGITVSDDGSVKAALVQSERIRFTHDYIGNGEIHIYESDTRELLSRLNAFIPVNFFLDHKASKKEIAFWQAQAASRLRRPIAQDNIPTFLSHKPVPYGDDSND